MQLLCVVQTILLGCECVVMVPQVTSIYFEYFNTHNTNYFPHVQVSMMQHTDMRSYQLSWQE